MLSGRPTCRAHHLKAGSLPRLPRAPQIHSEEEVRKILPLALKHQVPVTFRAAGTSLSGQALTDSVLLKLSHTGRNFRNFTVHGDGSTITVEPGLIGGEVNRILAAHKSRGGHPVQYKIGPDPSSIDSCMVRQREAQLVALQAHKSELHTRLGKCRVAVMCCCLPRSGPLVAPLAWSAGRWHCVQQLLGHVLRRQPELVPYHQGHAHRFCGWHW